jgi:hypothetical protein
LELELDRSTQGLGIGLTSRVRPTVEGNLQQINALDGVVDLEIRGTDFPACLGVSPDEWSYWVVSSGRSGGIDG